MAVVSTRSIPPSDSAQTAVEQLSLDLLYFIPSGGKPLQERIQPGIQHRSFQYAATGDRRTSLHSG